MRARPPENAKVARTARDDHPGVADGSLHAGSAPEALEILKSNSQISVLVTDHAMPRMTGAELIQRVRAQWPELPTILATGFAEASEELARGVPRISKPFGQEELARAISDVFLEAR